MISVVNLGINQDLLDYINALFAKYNESTSQYENIILRLCESINDYTEKTMDLSVKIDIYNAHIFKSKLIRNIVNFYKPKRDRMLRLTSQINLVEDDRVLGDGTSDGEYNNLYLNNTDPRSEKKNPKENGLHNRSRIRQEINEYIPFNDLIYVSKERNDCDVNSFYELMPDSDGFELPVIESYGKVESFSAYKMNLDDGVYTPNFYCSCFGKKYDGFYYKQSDNYYLNDYLFIKRKFSVYTKYNLDGVRLPHEMYVDVELWCFIKKTAQTSNDPLRCIFVSKKNISSTPYQDSNGEPMKYMSLENINNVNDFILALNENSRFQYGLFQVNNSNSDCVKLELKYLEPSFYIKGFFDVECNGYYYKMDTKSDMPIYKNQKGKMISYYDLSYMDSEYLDFAISECREEKCTSFWILTDEKEIVDISDATYIAFDNGTKSIFNSENTKTKSFYPVNLNNNKYKTNLLFVRGIYGISVSEITEHPEYLDICDRKHLQKYDMSNEYQKIFGRRISQNILPEKYEPVSYYDFKFDHDLIDYYRNDKIQISYLDSKGSPVKLFKSRYTYDDNHNQTGSLIINPGLKLSIVDSHEYNENSVFTIIIRSRYLESSDNEWHNYIYRLQNNKVTITIDDMETGNILSYSNRTINIQSSKKICVSEFAYFEEYLPDWYLKIVNEYGIRRYRDDSSKMFNKKSKNNYTPLFATERPRNIYGCCMTGLPARTQGDRISSRIRDFDGQYLYPEFDPNEAFTSSKWYKWNAASLVNKDKPTEISALWSWNVSNRVYDRKVTVQYNTQGDIVGVNVDPERIYRDSKCKLHGTEDFYNPYKRVILNSGICMEVPNNYNLKDDVPCWWVKDRNDYKTGDVTHRPVYISIKQKIEDPYPVVKHGEKCVNYFDYDHLFDGYSVGGGELEYLDSKYDVNTNCVVNRNEFLKEEEFIEKYSMCPKQYASVVDGHDNKYCCPCSDMVNATVFYDPSTSVVTQKMKENCIYHEYVRIYSKNTYTKNISGVYAFSYTVPFQEDYDLSYCYSNSIPTSHFNKFSDIIHGRRSTLWSSSENPKTIKLIDRYIAVPVYHSISDHYYWEIRHLKYYLTKDNIDINNKSIVQHQETKIVDNENNKYTYVIELKKILHTYIKERKVVSNSLEQYDFINQLQLDLCGQKLCEYTLDPTEFLSHSQLKYMPQKIVDNTGFVNYVTVKFKKIGKNKSIAKKYFNTENRYYLDNDGLYVNFDSDWYGPFMVKKNVDIPEKLYDMQCGIDCVFTMHDLYIMVQEEKWVSVYFNTGFVDINNSLYEPYKLDNGDICVNTPFTDPKLQSWSYFVDQPNIMATFTKYKELFTTGTDQLGHWNEELPEDKMDEFYSSYNNKQTITDFLKYYVYYICKLPKESICFPEVIEDIESKFKHIDRIRIDKIIPYKGVIKEDPCNYTTDCEFKNIGKKNIQKITPNEDGIIEKDPCNYNSINEDYYIIDNKKKIEDITPNEDGIIEKDPCNYNSQKEEYKDINEIEFKNISIS